MAPTPQPDTAVHAAALQSILASLGVLTVQQLVDLFDRFDGTTGFPALLQTAVPEIVGQHAQAAATVTAQWYDELNSASTFRATPIVDLAPERITKSIDWALRAPNATLQSTPAELTTVTEPAPPDTATSLTRLSGSAKRMVYDASRTTVVHNASSEGVKWARYAFPDACAFCRVLATRPGTFGSLYGREKSAAVVVGKRGRPRGTRQLGEKYHDHCRCIAYAIRGEPFEIPAYAETWFKQYEDAREATKSGDLKDILAHMRANTDAA